MTHRPLHQSGLSPRRGFGNVRFLAGAFVAFFLAGAPANADTLHLKGGKTIVCRIISETDTTVRVITGSESMRAEGEYKANQWVRLTIPRGNIESIERSASSDFVRQRADYAIWWGNELLKQGDEEGAWRTFEEAFKELESDLSTITAPPASVLALKESLDKSRNSIVIDRAKRDPEALFRQAVRSDETGDSQRALELIEELVRAVPDEARYQLKLAEVAGRLDKGEVAIKAYKTVLELDPESHYDSTASSLLRLLRSRGDRYLAEERLDEAIETYKDVIDLESNEKGVPVRVSDYLRRRVSRVQRPEEQTLKEVFDYADQWDLVDLAFGAASKIQKIKPEDPEARKLVQETQLVRRFRDNVKAGRIAEAVDLRDSAPPELLRSGRVTRRIEKLSRQDKRAMDAQSLLNRTRRELNGGDYRDAAGHARDVIRKYPDLPQAGQARSILDAAEFEAPIKKEIDRARGHLSRGRYTEAEVLVEQILNRERIRSSRQYPKLNDLKRTIPQERKADELWKLAKADMDADKLDTAVKRLDQLKDKYPDTKAGQRAENWLNDYRRRAVAEARRKLQIEKGLFETLSDPNTWRLFEPVAVSGSDTRRKISAIAEQMRAKAWAAFDTAGLEELARKTDERRLWLHVGIPMGGGGLILIGSLIGLTRRRRPPAAADLPAPESMPPGDESVELGKTTNAVLCPLCGHKMQREAATCPLCGGSSQLIEAEATRRARKESDADFDPWEARLKPKPDNRFAEIFTRARRAATLKNTKKAITLCRQALREDPGQKEGYELLAEMYRASGNYDDAAACCREVLLLDPGNTTAIEQLELIETPLNATPMNMDKLILALSVALWWLIYWMVMGLDPGLWIWRTVIILPAPFLTYSLWRSYQSRLKYKVEVPRRKGGDVNLPLPEAKQSWKRRDEQARLIAEKIEEHTGIKVPALTSWRSVAAISLSFALLLLTVAVAWLNHAPYVFLGWPAGVLLFFYLLEIHPRVLTAHVLLRHVYEETHSPWLDPHLPFRPEGTARPAEGEFLISSPEEWPLRWALDPTPHTSNRQGVLNSLQQALNRHWGCHRFYEALHVPENHEIPMPIGPKFSAAATATLVSLAFAGLLTVYSIGHARETRFDEAMTLGYEGLLEGNVAAAKRYFNEAKRLDGTRALPHLYMAHAHAAENHVNVAEVSFRLATQLAPDFPTLYNDYANFLQRTGRLNEALPVYEIALRQDPENTDILNNAGAVYFKRKNYETALDYLKRAVELNADHRRAYTTLGLVYEELGRRSEAREAYESAIRIAPKDPYTDVARGRLEEGLKPKGSDPFRLTISSSS